MNSAFVLIGDSLGQQIMDHYLDTDVLQFTLGNDNLSQKIT